MSEQRNRSRGVLDEGVGLYNESKVSRRKFLRASAYAIGSAGLAAIGIVSYDAVTGNGSGSNARNETLTLEGKVNEGLLKKWDKVAVWPGLLVFSPAVALYSSPTLETDTQISWPDKYSDYHLLVQRPFFVQQSTALNMSSKEADTIDVNTVGFCLPGSNEMAYGSLYDYFTDILPATHSTAAVIANQAKSLIGQLVVLQNEVTESNGLYGRYLKSTEITGNFYPFNQKMVVDKVVGRSRWGNEYETAYAVNAFETGIGDDIVQLPNLGGQHG